MVQKMGRGEKSLQSRWHGMLMVALAGNVIIGLICLLLAWRLWRLKQALAQVADTLLAVERVIHNVLKPAPRYILIAQSGTHGLRAKYQQLGFQLEGIQQILSLLGFGQQVWRRSNLARRTQIARNRSARLRRSQPS
jgi:hypothetical protein